MAWHATASSSAAQIDRSIYLVQGLQAKAHRASRSGKEVRNVLKSRIEVSMSVTPTVSRMECMLSEGTWGEGEGGGEGER